MPSVSKKVMDRYMQATKKLTQPIKIHGGKHYLARKIVELMPPHRNYVEPFFGGGSVLLAKDPQNCSEVVNDLNKELTIFWKILQSGQSFYSFQRIVQAMPFSEVEWNDAGDSMKSPLYEGCEGVKQAVDFFIRCRQSLAGRMKDFAPISTTRLRRRMNEQVSAWLTAVEGLPEVHKRLQRVVILDARPALEVIKKFDTADTLFYLDPPYDPITRESVGQYSEEMDHGAHAILLHSLSEIKGKFMLSGYHSDMYKSFSELHKWTLHQFSLPNNAASGEKKRRMIECLWTNF